MKYQTEQEEFWAGRFGDDYISRNSSEENLASNLNFFARALKQTGSPKSLIEFGANVGINLKAIKLLYPNIKLHGIEINQKASEILGETIGQENVSKMSIFDYIITNKFEIALIKGVLIHIHPQKLDSVYEKLYAASSRYILICEYYNPVPVAITYRGHTDRLFKRDFAGEFLLRYTDFKLVDYGFVYKGDPGFPQDDVTWFLLEKK